MADTVVQIMREKREFLPQKLSDDENEFLYDRAGQNPSVALEGGRPVPAPVVMHKGQQVPHKGGGVTLYEYTLSDGRTVRVNRALMQEVMGELRTLQDAADSTGQEWCGYKAIKECVRFWLDKYRAEFKRLKQIDPKLQHPSRFSYDSRGNAIYQGIGSDSREVRTWIDKDGKRRQFGIPLTERPPNLAGNWFAGLGIPAKDPKQIDELVDEDPDALKSDETPEQRMQKVQIVKGEDQPSTVRSAPPAGAAVEDVPTELIVDEDRNAIECPLCHHTEIFKEGNVSSRNMARARMSRHLTSAKEEVDAHRRLKYEVFGG